MKKRAAGNPNEGRGKRDISVCPNCGRILQGPEFLTSVPVMTQQVGIDFDPVAGRFYCPDCNYSGVPITVPSEDYGKITFERKAIAPPLARSNPFYWQMVLFSLFLFFLGVAFSHRIYGIALAILGGLLVLYSYFMIPKYQKPAGN